MILWIFLLRMQKGIDKMKHKLCALLLAVCLLGAIAAPAAAATQTEEIHPSVVIPGVVQWEVK